MILSESQKHTGSKKSPQWLPWLCILLFVLLVAWIGYMADSLIGRETLMEGPVPLRPNVQAKVEYPRRLHMDDQNTEASKKIVVSIMQTENREPEQFHVTIVPTTTLAGVVRFLSADGTEISGRLPITATYGDFNPASLYIVHTNATLPNRSCASVPFDVLVTLPKKPITSSIKPVKPVTPSIKPVKPITSSNRIDDLGFEVRVEGPVAKVGREIWATFVSKVSLFSILALIGGWFIKDWWEVRQEFHALYSKMQQQERKGNLKQAQELYGQYHELKTLPWHRNSDIENLHRKVEARIHYEDAMKALKAGEEEEAAKRLRKAEESIDLTGRAQALAEVLSRLDSSRKEEQEAAWGALAVALKRKDDLSVQILAISALLHQLETETQEPEDEDRTPEDKDQKPEDEGRKSEDEDRTPEEEWLGEFSLKYNPFEATIAEAESDDSLGRYFFTHPSYDWLQDSGSQSTALFADVGCGKTSCRRRLMRFLLDDPSNLVLEYTNFDELVVFYETMLARTRGNLLEGLVDFSELVRDVGKSPMEIHVRGILQQASTLLGAEVESLSPSNIPWREQLRHLIESAQAKGYTTIYVLVGNVDGYAETQVNIRVAELLVRHLVGSFDLLDTANLCFKFFLPLCLKERLLKYGGFATGRIMIVDLVWDEDLLQQVIQVRMQAASNYRVDGLMALADEHLPINLDRLLVEQAQGSPCRLITLVNMLFRSRAQTYHESCKSSKELRITMVDWAALLKQLLRQGDLV